MEISTLFADTFDKSFKSAAKSISTPNEVTLFQRLVESIQSLNTPTLNTQTHNTPLIFGIQFKVETYHGNRHQVCFSAINSTQMSLNPNRRCELCDLMIIVYSSKLKLARLTFLQAKYERKKVFYPSSYNWKANLVQWDLLFSRPRIVGCGKFTPPHDLLQSALLPSVGSFGFFFRNPDGEFEVFYSSANCLYPKSLRKKECRLILSCHNFPYIKNLKTTSGAFDECQIAFGNHLFAKNLYEMNIGTPIGTPIKETSLTRKWLGKVLRGMKRENQRNDNPSELSQELLNLIGEEQEGEEVPSFGARSLIIIKNGDGGIVTTALIPEP